jgi:hypothetical protein
LFGLPGSAVQEMVILNPKRSDDTTPEKDFWIAETSEKEFVA